jgi:hypothetical protein
MIEWHKHQAPEVWASLVKQAGFYIPKIRWSSFNMLYSIGKFLTANRFSEYLLHSHFCIRATKSLAYSPSQSKQPTRYIE